MSPVLSALVIMLLPLLLSGPLRTITGLSLATCLWLSLPTTLLLLLPFRRELLTMARGNGAWRRAASDLALLLIASASIGLLFNRYFDGLVNYVGSDGGEHAELVRQFATTNAHAYNGCTSMFGLIFWLQRLFGLDVFGGMSACFYVAVAFTGAVPLIATSYALCLPAAATARAFLCGLGLALLINLELQYRVILPIEHYNQSDGFFPHVFGFVPLLILWLVDGLVRPRRLRIALLMAGVVLYRYTYVLNLADVLVSLSVLLLLESFHHDVSVVERWLLRGAPLVLCAGAAMVLLRLRPILDLYGWFREYDQATLLTAQLLGAGVLSLVASHARTLGLDGAVERWLRLPVVFGVVNVAGVVGLSWLQPNARYYLLKYPIHGVVLLAAALALAAAGLLLSLRQGTRALLVPKLTALALLGATVGLWSVALREYRPSFVERAFNKPPFRENRPLADRDAMRRIHATLEREHEQFGGYLIANMPMFIFTNAAFGYYNGGQEFWRHGSLKQEPGYCVFWEDPKGNWWGDWEKAFPLRRTQEALQADPAATCEDYPAKWDPSRRRVLCHRCY